MKALDYVKDLISVNQRFIRKHGDITIRDLCRILSIKNLMEESIYLRDQVQAGDIIICKGINAATNEPVYYNNGHLQSIDKKGRGHICVVPYTPFVTMADSGISFNVSGGYWRLIDCTKLVPAKETFRSKNFKTWSHLGQCVDGDIYFDVKVCVWFLDDTSIIDV